MVKQFKIKVSEDQIHAAIVTCLRMQLRDAVIHHPRNEGNRRGKAGIIDGARGKRMGVKAGYPDLVIHYRGATYFIEVKPPGKYLSPVQRDLRTELQAQGFAYWICQSVEDAMAAASEIKARRVDS